MTAALCIALILAIFACPLQSDDVTWYEALAWTVAVLGIAALAVVSERGWT